MTSEERSARTRVRKRAWVKQWRIDNPELALAKDARRRAAILADPAALERRRQTAAAWRAANPEKVRAAQERRNVRRRANPSIAADNRRRAREWRESHPEEFRGHSLARRGITTAEYDARLAEQGHVCAICHRTDSRGHRLAVDHDHATGAIRGLLCKDCNLALGLFGDNTERLIGAIDYLGRSRLREAVA